LRIRKKRIAFVDFEETRDPQFSRAGKQSIGALDVEIARTPLGKDYVAHGFERHANEQMKMATLRLDEHLHGHVVGDVVRSCAKWQEEGSRTEQKMFHVEHFFLYFGMYPAGKTLCGSTRTTKYTI